MTPNEVRKRFNTAKLFLTFVCEKHKTKIKASSKKIGSILPSSKFDGRKPTAKDASDFRAFLQLEKDYAYDTWLGKLKQIKTYFKRINEEKKLHIDIFDGLKVNKPLDQSARIKESRIQIPYSILEWVDDNLKTAFDDGDIPEGWFIYGVLLRWTGARKNEPLQLGWDDVEFSRKRINMPALKTGRHKDSHRLMPMFADSPLEEYLQMIFERQGRPTEGYVVRGILKLNDVDRSKVNWSKWFHNIREEVDERWLIGAMGQALPKP